jgi:hypothetical protein
MKYTIKYLTHYRKADSDMLVLGYFVLGIITFGFVIAWLLGERLPYQTLPAGVFIYIFVVLRHVRKRRSQKDKNASTSDCSALDR